MSFTDRWYMGLKQTFDPRDYSGDVPLGNAEPTNVWAMIENTPGNTPLNRAKGGLYEWPGKYQKRGDSWKYIW